MIRTLRMIHRRRWIVCGSMLSFGWQAGDYYRYDTRSYRIRPPDFLAARRRTFGGVPQAAEHVIIEMSGDAAGAPRDAEDPDDSAA
jgi:hypothetical protein